MAVKKQHKFLCLSSLRWNGNGMRTTGASSIAAKMLLKLLCLGSKSGGAKSKAETLKTES
jgi:hypothetical protein